MGNLYIADTNKQRIREVSGGAIVTIAGTGEQGFNGDGRPLTSAVLNALWGVATDAAGNVLIADTLGASGSASQTVVPGRVRVPNCFEDNQENS